MFSWYGELVNRDETVYTVDPFSPLGTSLPKTGGNQWECWQRAVPQKTQKENQRLYPCITALWGRWPARHDAEFLQRRAEEG